MPSKKRLFGDVGETIASNYLKNNDYSIVIKNYQAKFGEIDIIARKNNEFIFIEVKTSNSNSKIPPEENFTKNKFNKVLKTSEIYLLLNKISPETPHRIDLIVIKLNKLTQEANLKHFKNISL
jgi:putative endonuclease